LDPELIALSIWECLM